MPRVLATDHPHSYSPCVCVCVKCITCMCVMSYEWVSQGPRVHESQHTYEWITAYRRALNGSCHTYERIMSHVSIKGSCHRYESCHTHGWAMSHTHTHTHTFLMWKRHVTLTRRWIWSEQWIWIGAAARHLHSSGFFFPHNLEFKKQNLGALRHSALLRRAECAHPKFCEGANRARISHHTFNGIQEWILSHSRHTKQIVQKSNENRPTQDTNKIVSYNKRIYWFRASEHVWRVMNLSEMCLLLRSISRSFLHSQESVQCGGYL